VVLGGWEAKVTVDGGLRLTVPELVDCKSWSVHLREVLVMLTGRVSDPTTLLRVITRVDDMFPQPERPQAPGRLRVCPQVACASRLASVRAGLVQSPRPKSPGSPRRGVRLL
jgi:hypothetical protein